MKLKLDENLDLRLVPLFAEGGHDVSTVKQQGLSGAPDEEVFRVAVSEGGSCSGDAPMVVRGEVGGRVPP